MDDEYDLYEDDDLDDEEGDDDDAVTMPCPHCFGTIYDDSVRCPHCEKYLSYEDSPRRKPGWIWFGLVVSLLIAAKWAKLDEALLWLFRP